MFPSFIVEETYSDLIIDSFLDVLLRQIDPNFDVYQNFEKL